jgi:hypothetical protein
VNGGSISLPRQHSLLHYIRSIHLFGSPNGLCSSITESKHIKAVKEPWRRSSRYKALSQMLRTLCRLDKLAAACTVFTELGMMDGTTAAYTAMIHAGGEPQQRAAVGGNVDDDNDNGPVAGPKTHSAVELARIPGAFFFLHCQAYLTTHIYSSRLPKLNRGTGRSHQATPIPRTPTALPV